MKNKSFSKHIFGYLLGIKKKIFSGVGEGNQENSVNGRDWGKRSLLEKKAKRILG